jgi:hypothetical protein
MQKTKQKAQETNKQGPTHERTTQKGKKHTKNQKKKTETDLQTNYMLNSMSTFHRPRKLSHERKPKKTKNIKTAFLLATKIAHRSKTKIHTRISNK